MSTRKMKDDIELKYGLAVTFAGMLVFACFNKIVKLKGPPKGLKRANLESKWRNVFVSYVHAMVISCWALASTVLYPELMFDLLGHINYCTYFCVCFTTGYFTYDLLDNTLNGMFISNWEVTLHHILNLSVFYFNVYLKENIGFNIMALYLEVNSIFLHWRKILQMTGELFSSRKYVIIKHLNILSVVLFRFPATFLITWACYAFHDRVPLLVAVLVFIACPFMNILNTVVLYRLVKSDILRCPDGKPSTIVATIRRDWSTICFGEQVLKHKMNGHSNGHGLTNGHSKTAKIDSQNASNESGTNPLINGHAKSS